MLTAEHLARWRAHCLAKLGDREAVDAAAAAIHDPHEGTLTVVARVEHTAYVLLSPDEQARRVDGWGRVLAALASSDRVARLQILESAPPDSGDGILGWWQHHGVGAEPNFVRKQYDTLMRTYAPSASPNRSLIAIAVGGPARSTWTPGPLKGLEMLRQEMARSNPGCAPPTCASSPGSTSPNSRR